MANRKLIRPNLAEIKERMNPVRNSGSQHAHAARENHGHQGSTARRRTAPPEQTSAESFYYVKQMNNKTPMVVVLDDGERLRGQIEWYDKTCIKVNRDDAPNLLVFKHAIKYVYKQEEEEEAESEPKPVETKLAASSEHSS